VRLVMLVWIGAGGLHARGESQEIRTPGIPRTPGKEGISAWSHVDARA
jgi:hypothetical protein